MAPAARKYDAPDASPSTFTTSGLRYRLPVGITNRDQLSRTTVTPKRAIRLSVISTYGFEISSPSTSIAVSRPVIGSAISSAVRNWLDTSPRTRTGPFATMSPPRRCSGGKPSWPR
jgi:hypothetical protein